MKVNQPSFYGLSGPRKVHAKTTNYSELLNNTKYTHDAMDEFRKNGLDSPYNPDEDINNWGLQPGELSISGLGPAATFLRQKSCPEPERSPLQRLPRPRSLHHHWEGRTSTPIDNDLCSSLSPNIRKQLTKEQLSILCTLSDDMVWKLLRDLQASRSGKPHQAQAFHGCRFCKNNGEREDYYRTHVLKDADGRVLCPVLRALHCQRCGAKGDEAHTRKYCPFSTNEERIKSTAMMHSVRISSGKRRHSYAPPATASTEYLLFGEPAPSSVNVNKPSRTFHVAELPPLDPLWAALERKLLN